MQTVNFQDIIKIRERGQITLPVLLRKRLDWLEPQSVVEIKAEEEKLVLKPIIPTKKMKKEISETNWNILEKKLNKIRTWGDQNLDLTKFVIADRRRH